MVTRIGQTLADKGLVAMGGRSLNDPKLYADILGGQRLLTYKSGYGPTAARTNRGGHTTGADAVKKGKGNLG